VVLVKSTLPDLVLMDLDLPGIDGWKALTLLKNDERTSNIPVFALSASASNETLERAEKAGFSSFLSKPVRLKELFEALLTAVNKNPT
jgi:CheY-like chemotaxis protein